MVIVHPIIYMGLVAGFSSVLICSTGAPPVMASTLPSSSSPPRHPPPLCLLQLSLLPKNEDLSLVTPISHVKLAVILRGHPNAEFLVEGFTNVFSFPHAELFI